MEKSRRTVFICQQCGHESAKWLGRCPQCEGWNTFAETLLGSSGTGRRAARTHSASPEELSTVSSEDAARIVLSFVECNRVLGGGIVPGSLVLIGGDPGIGKSTLLLQISASVAQRGKQVVYVSGEESPRQLRLRATRLGLDGERLFVLPETNMETISEQLQSATPDMVVIDSIQTVYLENLDSTPGSIGQIRECTMKLMRWAKATGVPVLLSGHVTKDGSLAGPRVLEHVVDVVLYLEGERFSTYRLLRGVKNRFGSTNEVGVFEMRSSGLLEVSNPSQVLLSQRPQETVGSAVVPTLEGSRPLLVEIQALTSTTSFGLPRRTANGVEFNRLLMVTAVLTKRASLSLGNQDIMVNVTGGLRVSEPAADLAMALAIASSLGGVAIDPGLVALGELGLSGELRAVPQVERRLTEAAKLGFERCLIPAAAEAEACEGMQLIRVATVKEALRRALSNRGEKAGVP